jgi:vancomycin resistance protein YoaR
MRAEPGVSGARERAYFQERRKAQARAARFRRRVAMATLALLVILTVGIGVGFAGSTDRVAAGVAIGGVDVGGMTADEARHALAARHARVEDQPVVFTHGDQRFPVVAGQAGIEPDWDAAVAQALDEGEGFVLFRGFKRLALRIGGHDVSLASVVDQAQLASQVERISSTIDRPAVDAALVLEGLAPKVQPAQDGVQLERGAAATVIGEALAGFDRGETVPLPVKAVEPDVRAPDLQQSSEQLRVAVSGPVELAYRNRSFKLTPSQIGTLLVLPAGGTTELAVGGKAANRYFGGIAKRLDREPADADFTLTSGGAPRVVPAHEGRVVDRDASMQALLTAALATAPDQRSAGLVVETAQPKVTTADAKAMGIVGVVGSYTTVYGGDPNRLHNVQLVSQLLDDHLIAPGKTFSFNETTGERNADKGFLEAPVIINGELQTGLGGGVCQVSTTVFNAAFEAGLSIEERTNHALYISHYPTGRDATVNYPDTDLKFTNDTGHWLWLRTFAGSSELTVVLYGTPAHRRVEIQQSPLEVVSQPTIERVFDPTLDKGTRILEEAGEPSRSVSVRRIVYDADGKVLYDTVWYSSYVSEPRVVRIGTKPLPVEEVPETGGTKPDTGGGTAGGQGGGTGTGAGTGSGGGTGGATGGGTGGGAGSGTGGGAGGGSGGTGGSGSGSGSGSGGGTGGGSGGQPPPSGEPPPPPQT